MLFTCTHVVDLSIVLYCIVLYCIVLYCIVLYCIVLYCIVLYCIVLYCNVLYCIVVTVLHHMGRLGTVSDHCNCNYLYLALHDLLI